MAVLFRIIAKLAVCVGLGTTTVEFIVRAILGMGCCLLAVACISRGVDLSGRQ